MKQNFSPKKAQSMMLRCHCQTSEWSLTDQVYQNALELINEVEQIDRMVKAIVAGMPNLKTEECAA
jgi:methylmalonyl-CoA mutase N-terminal domain/subunit